MTQSPNRAARVTAKIEGSTNALAGFVRDEIAKSEAKTAGLLTDFRIEVVGLLRKPDRLTDRALMWVKEKRASWLIWPLLAFTHALAASIWRALGQ